MIPSLQTLDLQNNKINEVEILEILSLLPDLRVLYLQGNPVVKMIPHYRKTIISRCLSLKYLDDRPVFEEERRRCQVWIKAYDKTGDINVAHEAERNEIRAIKLEKDTIDEQNYRAFEQMVFNGKKNRDSVEKVKYSTALDQTNDMAINDDIKSCATMMNPEILKYPVNKSWVRINIDEPADQKLENDKLIKYSNFTSLSTSATTSSQSMATQPLKDNEELYTNGLTEDQVKVLTHVVESDLLDLD
jgi:dynein assembly factor 1